MPQAPKGGKRPKAANHRHAIPADESKGIQPEPAGSREPIAFTFAPSGSFPPTGIYRQLRHYRLLPRSFASLRMTMRAGRQYRNVGSFPRKELGEALRIGPKI